MSLPKLLVISHTNLGTSLSGGDRIFLNLIKYWQDKFEITTLASPEASRLITRNKLTPQIVITTTLPTTSQLTTLSLIFHHTQRFLSGLFFSLTHPRFFKESQYIYTSSDFYGDFIFGVIAKIYNPKIKWLCGYYLLAPFPTDPTSPWITNKHWFRGLVYYLAQRPTVLLAKLMADAVYVTSTPDIQVFQNHRLNSKNIIIVQGGVHIPTTKTISQMKPLKDRRYDAFFLGRLHNQKGIMEMVDIWHLVTQKLPQAKLVIVGDGELMTKMTQKIKDLKLTKNITVIGFLVGPKKFALIKNSKVVLHPATYDSGGMAAAEAMAWGLPGVSFDLPALKTYYPKGMIKVPLHNFSKFADTIIKLLSDSTYYKKHSVDARQLTIDSWNWQKRFSDIYDTLTALE